MTSVLRRSLFGGLRRSLQYHTSSHYNKNNVSTSRSTIDKKKITYPTRQPQQFKYFLILDLEATCDKEVNQQPVQEVIEFPVLKMNSETLEVESEFHEYVRPRLYPQLSDFCTSLTGIVQDEVDQSSLFPEVLTRYNKWFKDEVGKETYLTVTCGDWDLLTQIPRQSALDHLQVHPSLRKWHNIKLSYCSVMKDYSPSMKGILKGLELFPVGQPHRGVDDCRNIVNIVTELVRRGVVMVPTRQLPRNIP